MINIEKLEKTFPKPWINQVRKIYDESASKTHNRRFFTQPGEYANRSVKGKIPEKTRNDYFQNLLYGPNYAIIDYVIANKGEFKNTINVDSGCGMGLLSIFLDKIGITCLNYDNYSQIEQNYRDIEHSQTANNLIDLYNKQFERSVPPVLNKVHHKAHVVFCSGCTAIEPAALLDAKLYLLDYSYIDHPYVPINFENYDEIYDYPTLIKVYRKKEK